MALRFSKKEITWMVLVLVACGAIILLLAHFDGADNGVTPHRADPVSRERQIVSAENLIKAYEDNEVAADRSYKGQSVVVSGEVENIGKDIVNTMYVVLKGERTWGTQCMFSDDHEPELARLSKGQRVTLVGTVQGKMGNVILRDCKVG